MIRSFKDHNLFLSYNKSKNISSNFDFIFSIYIENQKKDPINSNSIFYNDSFNGLSADLQQSYLNYSNKFLKIKIGRDFFIRKIF